MGETKIDGVTRRQPVTEHEPDPRPAEAARASRDAAARAERWVATSSNDSNAAADAAWAAVANARPLPVPAVPNPTCARPLAMPDDAPIYAARGVPLGLALQQASLFTVPELEKFIDDYLAFTATRPELRSLHEDAVRRAPEVFSQRLDREEVEQQERDEHRRMADRMQLMVVRPPLVIAQRAAVGEVAIPIARAVDAIAKFVPIAGELLAATEVLTGRTLGGLGFDIPASERALSAALLVVPYATTALKMGVRGAAELVRLARATGRTTEETRRLCTAVLTLQKNRAALEGGLAATKAGRPLTAAQSAAIAEANGALRTLGGAAARSRLDAAGQGMMSRAEKAALPTFAPNAGGAARSVDEAVAIAGKHGVTIPSYIKVVADPAVVIEKEFANYTLVRDLNGNLPLRWDRFAKEPIVVRVHPSILNSDEAIVGILQHETYELEQLRLTMQKRGALSSDDIARMVDGKGTNNLHGQAWDVADLRVLIMREHNPAKQAVLVARLQQRLAIFHKMNFE